MARQEIILGTAPTGLGGDPPRTASTKINAMTTELYGITGALGTAANLNVMPGADDAFTGLPFKVVKQGDYGIGRPLSGRILPNTSTNRADVLARGTGFSLDLITSGDKPSGVTDGPMLTMGYDGTQGFQMQFDWRDGSIYTFPSASAAPSKTWIKQYNINNVNGTMALGAVMERGSVANGEFIKFSSGYMVCWRPTITPSLINASVISATWVFPATFVSTPSVNTNLASGDIAVTKVMNGPHAIGRSTTQCLLYICSQGGFVAADVTGVSLLATAHGWWK